MLNRRGQSTLEYAIIIAVIVGGLLVMQHYIKRGYEGKLKSASDDMGEQFDPGAYQANYTLVQMSHVNQTVGNGTTYTLHIDNQISNKTGEENLTAWDPTKNAFGQ
jgi:hypothetical protein